MTRAERSGSRVGRTGDLNRSIGGRRVLMGWLSYAGSEALAEIDDLELAHLQAAMRQCFARGKGFDLTIRQRALPGVRMVLWMHPAIPVGCSFRDGELLTLDLGWVRRMTNAALSEHGLMIRASALNPRDRRERGD